MITTRNNFAGANFEYTGQEGCTANGEYRIENGKIVLINITGRIVKDDVTYNFLANCDMNGNVNISGVPASIIADVAAEVAEIISEVEALNTNEE